MAHSATVSVKLLGPMDFKVVIDSTEASSASSKAIDIDNPEAAAAAPPKPRQIPTKFRVLGVMGRIASGSAATLAPKLEKAVDSSPTYQEVAVATADAEPSAMMAAPALVHVEGGKLRFSEGCDTGSDNTVRVEWICRRGWSDAEHPDLVAEAARSNR